MIYNNLYTQFLSIFLHILVNLSGTPAHLALNILYFCSLTTLLVFSRPRGVFCLFEKGDLLFCICVPWVYQLQGNHPACFFKVQGVSSVFFKRARAQFLSIFCMFW